MGLPVAYLWRLQALLPRLRLRRPSCFSRILPVLEKGGDEMIPLILIAAAIASALGVAVTSGGSNGSSSDDKPYGGEGSHGEGFGD